MRPASLKILGKRWTVEYKAMVKDELGECDLENQKLTIKDGLPQEQEKSTLLHETIHAISDSLGLNLSEKQVQGLETGLFDMNASNPRFFSHLKRRK